MWVAGCGREPLHQVGERHLALHLEKGIKVGKRDSHASRDSFPYLRKEERLLVHRQQNVVAFTCEMLEHELEVAEGVRSNSRTTIIAPHKAGKAADAQRIRVAHIEKIAALSEGGDRLSR